MIITPNRIKFILFGVVCVNLFYISSLFLNAPIRPQQPGWMGNSQQAQETEPSVVNKQAPPATQTSTAPPPPPPPPANNGGTANTGGQVTKENVATAAPPTPPPPSPPPPPVTAAAPAGSNSDLPFLILGMPTIPRKGDKGTRKYLTRAIQAVAEQLPTNDEQPEHEVILMVMNNRPGTHPEYEECKQKWMSSNKSKWFRFVDNPRIYHDPSPQIPEPKPNPHDHPGPQVRQQTLDVAGLLDGAANKCQHFQVIEDDVKLCPNALNAIIYAIEKANRYTARGLPWTGVRMSYGMNGITLKGSDLTNFREFLLLNLFLVPPDLLIIEWWAGKHGAEPYVGKRPFMQYKFNIYDHLGSLSSFEGRAERHTPKCFSEYTQMLWPIEQFHAGCRDDDINPCETRDEPASIKKFW